MTEISDLRAAVVGTGFIGVVHVESLRRLGVDVVGVVGSSPERAREKARTHPIPPPYESFEAMLDDPRVDVVHLTSPNDLHFPQAAAALTAGKHVVCEKPLAMTAAETGELLALARASGLVHAVNFNLRFYPQNQEARAQVADGAVGDVRLITGRYLQDWLMYDTDWNWRLEADRGGALRAVGDIGSHWIDLTGFVTGRRVESVMADLTTFMPVRRRPEGQVEAFAGKLADGSPQATVEAPITTEDTASILLRLEGGARGAVTVSQISAGRKNAIAIEVDGSQGALWWDGERPEELMLGHRDGPNQMLWRDPALLSPAAANVATLPGGHAEGYENTFKALYRAVYADVAAGGPADEPAYPTFAAGHEQALIGEAIAASARTGRWMDVARER